MGKNEDIYELQKKVNELQKQIDSLKETVVMIGNKMTKIEDGDE